MDSPRLFLNLLSFAAGAVVSKADREKAKRVCYGIIYGLGAYGLSKQLQGVDVAAAQVSGGA